MEFKFLIGDVAKYHNISKQTLIHYDRIDLLKPSFIEKNNYRYYSYEDLDKLDLILSLKEAGLSLTEIKNYMLEPSMDESINLLLKQSEKLHQHIQHLNQVKQKIDQKILEVHHVKSIDLNHDIKVVWKKERVILKRSLIDIEENDPGLMMSMKAFREYIASSDLYSKYRHYVEGVTVSSKMLKEKSYKNLDSIFIFLDKYKKGTYEALLKEGNYLCIQHYGAYTNTYESYDKLEAYMKENDFEIAGDALEIPIITSWSARTENEYVTEIQIPVKKIRT